ncbi:MAG: 2-dehydropantoate 2-reductase N-terminal domain-containing protein [Paenibacillus sp.]|uniref:ketopantoate reductase family protein n=1 Tax=Paenibacillus sp. TaxID=58172 RepID=UPI002911DB6D|nr:2-dehydropantoate 2-reductase N-terminal domain-containing protein [Paenibacillus sp.]MDU4695907.1 2-dehydropantoate 2-reductase N-terminal domain-containing protein [Paenibacillus sp.]
MKILVYGAGVLGSYLAHALIRGGNEVSVLARGARADELERDGIVLRHYFQRKTTVDSVRVIRTLEKEDVYDLIFVVMKYTDFRAVLPILASNPSRNLVLIGNNAEAREMQAELLESSEMEKRIAFGFQLSGGRREPGRTLIIRSRGEMVLGGLDGPISFQAELEQAFAQIKYKLTYLDNMEAWLKNHLVPIVMLNSLSQIHNGQMKQVARDGKLIRDAVIAMGEGFHVLETLGVPLIPAAQASVIRKHKRLVQGFLKLYHLLPVSRMIDGSFAEVEALAEKLQEWSKQAKVRTPHWEELNRRLQLIKAGE